VDRAEGSDLRPVTSLFPDPVHLLVREVLARRHVESLALLKPYEAQDIIARLNEWRLPIIDHLQAGKLGGYPAGASLEDVRERLKLL
jgi:hypothetical protein